VHSTALERGPGAGVSRSGFPSDSVRFFAGTAHETVPYGYTGRFFLEEIRVHVALSERHNGRESAAATSERNSRRGAASCEHFPLCAQDANGVAGSAHGPETVASAPV